MKPLRLLLLLATLGCLLPASAANGTIQIRVSVKFILDAAGNRPATGDINTDAEVEAQIAYGNWVLARMGRGQRLQLTEIVDLAGAAAFADIAAFGDGDDDDENSDISEFESEIQKDKARFAFRNDAINIYIVSGSSQGSCSCSTSAPKDRDIIMLSQGLNPDWVILHECGHFLGLPHTHTGQAYLLAAVPLRIPCTFEDPCATCPIVEAGDDGISDTLPDNSCWDRATLTARNPGATDKQIDDTFLNIMSYHGDDAAPRDPVTGRITGPADRSILTSNQLDVMNDIANGAHAEVASGRTLFVDKDNTAAVPNGQSKSLLGFGGPFNTLATGLSVAQSTDIVLLRPDTYTGVTVFNKALTLRATRGNAIIRAP